jgi:PhzF family phenazine biosynthesis protein
MNLPIYVLDAFASRPFTGNPAAVVPLDAWLPDATLQSIAAENNLAETAFFVPAGSGYHLRWFTPSVEVDLCGHATLASAFVVFTHLRPEAISVVFESASGPLTVTREDGWLVLDFPARAPSPIAMPPRLIEALGHTPTAVLGARDLLAVYDTSEEVAALTPDMAVLCEVDFFGIIVTAPGNNGVDFVSRFFAPRQGIPEDPVTGSAHCSLIPYWAARLGRSRLLGRQISKRGGEIRGEDRGGRVRIGGQVVPYLVGTLSL